MPSCLSARIAALAAMSTIAFAASPAAHATIETITGAFSGGQAYLYPQPMPGAGTFQITWYSAAPALYGEVDFSEISHDEYIASDGTILQDVTLSDSFPVDYFMEGQRTWRGEATQIDTTDVGPLFTHISQFFPFFGFNIIADPKYDGTPFVITISSVPEPATWAALCAGMFLIAALMRTRRVSSVQA